MVSTKENHIAYFIAINKGPVAESSMLTNEISVSDKHPSLMPPGISALMSSPIPFIYLSPMLLLHRKSLLYRTLQQHHFFTMQGSPTTTFFLQGRK